MSDRSQPSEVPLWEGLGSPSVSARPRKHKLGAREPSGFKRKRPGSLRHTLGEGTRTQVFFGYSWWLILLKIRETW